MNIGAMKHRFLAHGAALVATLGSLTVQPLAQASGRSELDGPGAATLELVDNWGVTWILDVRGSRMVGFIDPDDQLGYGRLYARGLWTRSGFDGVVFSLTMLPGGAYPPECDSAIWQGRWDPIQGLGAGTVISQNGQLRQPFQLTLASAPPASLSMTPHPAVLPPSGLGGEPPPLGTGPTLTVCDIFRNQFSWNVNGHHLEGVTTTYPGSSCSTGLFSAGIMTASPFDGLTILVGTLSGDSACNPVIWEATASPGGVWFGTYHILNGGAFGEFSWTTCVPTLPRFGGDRTPGAKSIGSRSAVQVRGNPAELME